MEFKMRSITVSQKQFIDIRSKWSQKVNELNNSTILDEISMMKFVLRVPIKLKNGNGFMLIKSRIEPVTLKDNVEMQIFANLLKPIVISILMGFLVSVLLIFTHFNVIAFILIFLIYGFIHFMILYARIVALSEEYLYQLKNAYAK